MQSSIYIYYIVYTLTATIMEVDNSLLVKGPLSTSMIVSGSVYKYMICDLPLTLNTQPG